MAGQRLGGFPVPARHARTPPAGRRFGRSGEAAPRTGAGPDSAGPAGDRARGHDDGIAAAPAGEVNPARVEVQSIEAFIAERGESLMRFAYLVTGQRADAEDLFQETLSDVHRKWDHVSTTDHPYAYVRTMMANRHVSARRRKWHGERPTDPFDMVVIGPQADDAAGRVDSNDALWQRLEGLPDRMRTVLVLRYFEDLDDAEIADTLGIAVSSVRATASRAIAQLRAQGGWA